MTRPVHILSKRNLHLAWKESRDSSANAGARGTDGVCASSFAANLDQNIANLRNEILDDRYGFSSLRGVKLAKSNGSFRLICVPTVRDRLVQRTVLRHLNTSSILPQYPASAFGFVPNRGVAAAVTEVTRLRAQYPWTFETDIQGFFDNIDRNRLAAEVDKLFKRSSLHSLMSKVIHCEVKETSSLTLKSFGMVRNRGIRQGMPLSPILSNIALRRFDAALTKHGLVGVRYVDDLVLFAESRIRALEAGRIVRELLAVEGLTIPDYGENSKTRISSRGDPVDFLGWSIRFQSKKNEFALFVSDRKLSAIKSRFTEQANFKKQSEEGKDLTQTLLQLSQMANAYLNTYKDAENHNAVRQTVTESLSQSKDLLIKDVFGQHILDSLTPRKRQFIGLNIVSKENAF